MCISWNRLLHSKIIQGFLVYSSSCFMHLFIIVFISFMHWSLSSFIGCGQALTLLIFFQMATYLSQLHLCNYLSFPNGLRLCIFSCLHQVILGLSITFTFFLYIHTRILSVATYMSSRAHSTLRISFSYFEKGSNDSRDVANMWPNNALKNLP